MVGVARGRQLRDKIPIYGAWLAVARAILMGARGWPDNRPRSPAFRNPYIRRERFSIAGRKIDPWQSARWNFYFLPPLLSFCNHFLHSHAYVTRVFCLL